jgi:hypothetical protein
MARLEVVPFPFVSTLSFVKHRKRHNQILNARARTEKNNRQRSKCRRPAPRHCRDRRRSHRGSSLARSGRFPASCSYTNPDCTADRPRSRNRNPGSRSTPATGYTRKDRTTKDPSRAPSRPNTAIRTRSPNHRPNPNHLPNPNHGPIRCQTSHLSNHCHANHCRAHQNP